MSAGRAPAQILTYIGAIFLTYLALGVMLMSGVDVLLPSLANAGEGRLAFIVQGVIGLALLIYAIRAPATVAPTPRAEPRATSYVALALLGVTVTAMELPTARETMRWVFGLVGGGLLVWAVIEYVARFVIRRG